MGGLQIGRYVSFVLISIIWTATAASAPLSDDSGSEQVGALIIIGGNSTPAEAYAAFFELAGGAQAHLIHIPTATERFEAIPDKDDYYSAWTQCPQQSFSFLHTRSRREATTEQFSRPLQRATGVWIGGGDQNHLADIYGDTPVTTELRAVVRRGGVVAGTSSGASILSQVMVSDESEHSLWVALGFSLCENSIVDCHFTERERIPRMLRMLKRYPQNHGVGVDEQTALVLRGDHASVLGKGTATFFCSHQTTSLSRQRVLKAGESLVLSELWTGPDEIAVRSAELRK